MTGFYCIQCGSEIDQSRGEHRIIGGDMRGVTPESAGRMAYTANLPFNPRDFRVRILPLTRESAAAAMASWEPENEGLVLLRLEAYVCSARCKSAAYPKWEAAWAILRGLASPEADRVA